MEETKTEIPAKFADMIKKIEEMSVVDLHELVKTIEAKFGVSASAVVAVGAGAGSGDGEAVAEKDSFTVHLASAGEGKIAVMKVIKEVLVLGLKEAKDMVDGAPIDIKQGIKKAEAEDFKKKIEAAGGKVELK